MSNNLLKYEKVSDVFYLRKFDDVFTNSKLIAKGSGINHKTIRDSIRKNREDLEFFGVISVSLVSEKNSEEKRGRKEEFYNLNEMQATFLITLLNNTEKVKQFKKELVKQFFTLRKVVAETKTIGWQDERDKTKLTRKNEADYIQEFVIYAKESGSKNFNRFWIHFSNLTNKLCGISSRDIATAKQLDKLERLEKLITGMIREKVDNKVEYHKAYKEIAKQISDIAKYII